MAEYIIQAKALNVDLEIEKGATFDPVITYKDSAGKPVDLTNWTAKSEFRDLEEPFGVLETLTELDGLILGGVDGTITYNIDKARNVAYGFVAAKQDLFLNDGTKDYKIIWGAVSVIERITQ